MPGTPGSIVFVAVLWVDVPGLNGNRDTRPLAAKGLFRPVLVWDDTDSRDCALGEEQLGADEQESDWWWNVRSEE